MKNESSKSLKKGKKNEDNYALQIIIDNLPFDTWLKDINGEYVAVNKSFEEYTGIPKEEIIGKSDFDLYPKEEAQIYAASDKAVLNGEKRGFFESIVAGKWKEEYKNLAIDDIGRIIGTTGFSRDISDRKIMEHALKESERSKATLLANLPGVAYRCINDKDWTMTFLSKGCFELTGYYPEELLGNKIISYYELISPKFRDPLCSKWTIDIQANVKSSDEYIIITKSGEEKWVWEQSIPVLDKDGNLSESEGFILDITEIKRVLKELDESEDRFRTIFEKAPLGIGIFSTNTGFVHQLNPRFGEILGRSMEELKIMDWKSYSHPDEIQENIDKLTLLKNKEINSFNMHKRYFKPDGSLVWVNMMIVPFEVETISDMHLCMIEDITDRKKKEEEIAYLSYHDVLTGLYNRTFFEEEQRRFDLSRKLPLSVIMGDVNGLKLINDSFGHNEGDKLLREIGKVLKANCRGEDIIARIGGDEFVILLAATDEIGASKLCNRINNACKHYEKTADRKTFYLSISLGHATKTEEGKSIDDLLREAESMLYRKKNPERKKVRKTIIKAVKNELIAKCFDNIEQYNNQLELTANLGEKLSLSPNKLKELQLLQETHDMGKLTLDESLLSKDLKCLSSEEMEEYQKHVETGYRIALAVPEMKSIATEILYHHEHWDGSGYPKGLKGEEIPLLSRIICITDAYDELTRGAQRRTPYAIEKHFLTGAGTYYDPSILKSFFEMIHARL